MFGRTLSFHTARPVSYAARGKDWQPRASIGILRPSLMRTTKPNRTNALLAGGAAVLIALCSCASTADKEPVHDVRWMIAHGQYQRAVQMAADAHAANPGDDKATLDWRMATVALLLDEGRKFSFEDRDLEALEKFRQAKEIAPEIDKTQNWIDATLDKLATRWTNTAQEWHSKNNLEQAVEDYEKALSFRADRDDAKAGLARALLQLNYRNGRSESYYDDGVRALDAYWLWVATHDFKVSGKYKPGHEKAEERNQQTASMIVDDRIRVAEAFEETGQFAAARSEYRIATLIDPDHEAAKIGLERAGKEAKAAEFLREADRRMMHADFDKAQKAIEDGMALTTRQGDQFEEAAHNLVQARLEKIYGDAMAREKDHDYEQAIVTYDAVLAEAERLTGQRVYKDVIARKDSLEQSVRDAKALYEQVATTQDKAEQLKMLRKIEILWPDYLDVPERIAALAAEIEGDVEPPRKR